MNIALVDTAKFPRDEIVVHTEDLGAGCADGVEASPWWNVDEPYTPMGCAFESQASAFRASYHRKRPTSPESAWHRSNTPAA